MSEVEMPQFEAHFFKLSSRRLRVTLALTVSKRLLKLATSASLKAPANVSAMVGFWNADPLVKDHRDIMGIMGFKRFFMFFTRSESCIMEVERRSGLRSRGLDIMLDITAAMRLSLDPKREAGGSGSVGKLTLGETRGVMVRLEVEARGCPVVVVVEEEALEAFESGRTGLKVKRFEVIVNSDGGTGACGKGGVVEVGILSEIGVAST